MKSKHVAQLFKYQKYGKSYSRTKPYNDPKLKYVNYGRLATTRAIARPSRQNQQQELKTLLVLRKEINHGETPPILALCGASIVNGLQRNSKVWKKYFTTFSSINLGIWAIKPKMLQGEWMM